MHTKRTTLSSIQMKTNRLLPLSLALLTVLAACKGKPTLPNPANPLIGNWTSTTPTSADGAAGCPGHYQFTDTAQTLSMAGREITFPVTYKVQPNLVTVVMPMRTNQFKLLTPNTVAWASGPCTYKRD